MKVLVRTIVENSAAPWIRIVLSLRDFIAEIIFRSRNRKIAITAFTNN